MKTFYTKRKSFLSVLCWMLIMFCFALPSSIKGQTCGTPYDGNGTTVTVATTCTRLVGTIVDDGDGVKIQVVARGVINIHNLEFDLFYDWSKYELAESNYDPIPMPTDEDGWIYNPSEFVPPFSNLANAVMLDPTITVAPYNFGFEPNFLQYLAHVGHPAISTNPMQWQLDGHCSQMTDYDLLQVKIENVIYTFGNIYNVPDGVIQPIFTIYLHKKTADPVLATDFGLGSIYNGGDFQEVPSLEAEGTEVTSNVDYYYEPSTDVILDQTLFGFRAPASVITNTPVTAGLSATLKGTMTVPFAEAHNMLNGIYRDISTFPMDPGDPFYDGNLYCDKIQTKGFIYTDDLACTVGFDEYTRKLKVNGTLVNMPDAGELSAGQFTRSGITFYITQTSATPSLSGQVNEQYSVTLTESDGLVVDTDYHGWAYITYQFENSEIYPLVGGMVTFKIEDNPCSVTILSVQKEDPLTCNAKGEITITFSTNNSASPELEWAFSETGSWSSAGFVGDVLTIPNLDEGTYTIYIHDVSVPDCAVAVTDPSITIQAWENDMEITVNSTLPANNCTATGGSLDITVSGGNASYSGTVDSTPIIFDGNHGTVTGSLTAGKHVVTVTSDGCTASTEITIGSSVPLVATAAPVPATCGTPSGEITIAVTSAHTGDFTYKINSTQYPAVPAPITISGLTAGTYTWEIQQDGCIASGTVEITNGPTSFTAAAEPINAQCTGDGSISLTVTNGTGTFNYSIGGTAYTGSFTAPSAIIDVAEGNYAVVVTQGACEYNCGTVSVGRNLVPGIEIQSVSHTNVTACGDNDGTITVVVTGATNYEYLLTGNIIWKTLPPTGIITNLSAGTYTLSLRDGDHIPCGEVTNLAPIVIGTIQSDLEITVSGVDKAATCTSNNGEIRFIATGGNGSYTYAYKRFGVPQLPAPLVSPIANLYPGSYELTVTSGSCTATTTAVVGAETTFTTAVDSTTTTTCGLTTGAIELTPIGAMLPYDYTIGVRSGSGITTSSVTEANLGAGRYSWTVTDANGCINAGTATILNGDNTFTADATVSNATCNNNGSITLTVTPSGTYDYVIGNNVFSGTFTGTTKTINNVPEATYKIVVSQGLCEYTFYKTVGKNNTPTVSITTITPTNESECGDGGTITLTVSGATNYEYMLVGASNVSWTPLASTGIISPLPAGSYTVSLRDADEPSCGSVTYPGIITIGTDASALAISATPTNPATCTSYNGKIDFTVSGNSGSMGYELKRFGVFHSNPSGSPITGLTSGSYELIGTDGGGCTATTTVVLTGNDFGGYSTKLTNTTCGAEDGIIKITLIHTPTGFPTEYPINYTLGDRTGILYDNNIIIEDHLAAGVYNWTLYNAEGCSTSSSSPIYNDDNNFVVNVTPTNTTCTGNDGKITITLSGGIAGAYTYNIGGGMFTGSINNPGSAIIPNVANAGYTVEVKQDGTECTFNTNVMVGKDLIPEIAFETIATTNATACGSNTGVITVTASGATNYEYKLVGASNVSWTPLASTGIISSLPAGSYTISLRDVDNRPCGSITYHENVIIGTDASDLAISASMQTPAPACGGNGQIKYTPSGGTGSYSYELTHFGVHYSTPTTNPTPAPTGSYELIVTSGGCTATTTVVVTADINTLWVSASSTNTICGVQDGSIILNITGGTAPYTYFIDDRTNNSDNGSVTESHFAAGNYTWSVYDKNECSRSGDVTITNTDKVFTAVATSTNTSCMGNDGTITVTVSGTDATGEFAVRIGNGTPQIFTAPSITISGVANANYSVEVYPTDATDCIFNTSVSVAKDPIPTVHIDEVIPQNASACGMADGKVTIGVSGAATYQYSIDNGTWMDLATNPATLLGIAVGNHTIAIRDKAQPLCGTATSSVFTIGSDVSDLTISADPTDAATCGGTGTITFTGNGGDHNYSYVLKKFGITQPTPTSPLTVPTGSYELIVTDGGGCQATTGTIIITAPGISSLADTEPAICGLSTGSITVTVTGGTQPYTYTLGGRTGESTSNIITETHFAAGEYSWVIFIPGGCSTEGSVTINNINNTISATASVVDATCSSDGAVTLTYTGGTGAAVTYALGTTAPELFVTSSVTIPDVLPGDYTAVITQEGCTYSFPVHVGQEYIPDVEIVSIDVTNATYACGATGNGKLTLTVNGALNYDYSIDGEATWDELDPSGDIENLSAGSYTVIIRDHDHPLCGNYAGGSVTIINTMTDLSVAAVGHNASDCVTDDGSITFTVSGGNGTTYNYFTILNGTETLITPTILASGYEIAGLSTGKYFIKVTSGSCTAISQEIAIATNTGIIVTPAITNTVCGSATGSITLTVDGGTGPFDYMIGGTSGHGPIAKRDNLGAGEYTWELTDATGCFASGNATVLNTGNNFTFTETVVDATPCAGSTDGEITLTVDPSGAYFYKLDGGSPQSFTTTVSFAATVGIHTVMVYPDGASDCTFSKQITVGQQMQPQVTITSVSLIHPTACGTDPGYEGQIIITAAGVAYGNLAYSIDGGATWSATFDSDYMAIKTGLTAGAYTVMVRDNTNPACGHAEVTVVLNVLSDVANFTYSVQNAADCMAKGSITITATTASTGKYTLTVDGTEITNTFDLTYTVGNLSIGNHTVTLADNATDCSKTVIVTINSNTPLNANATGGTLATCSSTMPITLNVGGGGTAPYTYIVGMETGPFTGTSIQIPGFAAGVYNWKISDVSGCFAEGTVEIKNSGLPPMYASVSIVNPSCSNPTEGKVIVTVYNGTQPYIYQLGGTPVPSESSATHTFDPVGAGIYTMSVKDDNNCLYSQSVVVMMIAEPAISILSATPNHPTACNASNGSITLVVSGAESGEYNYSIDEGSSWHPLTAVGGIITIPSLSAGTYPIWIQDADNESCGYYIGNSVVLENMNSNLQITGVGEDATTCGSNDGKINFTVTGGNGTYTYRLLKNGNAVVNGSLAAITTASGTITGLSTGKYVVEVTFATCVATTNEIDINANDMTVDSDITNTLCGQANGVIRLDVTNGSVGPYNYVIGGISGFGYTIQRGNLSAGEYTWEITDATGCFATGKDEVSNTNSDFTVESTVVNATCSNDGIIILTASKAGSYTYSLNGGTSQPFTTTTSLNVSDGYHTITVSNSSSCAFTFIVEVGKDNVSDINIASYVITNPTTCGVSGSIDITVAGGTTDDYEYKINEYGAWHQESTSSFTIPSLSAGTYTIYVQEQANTCGFATIVVTLNPTATDLNFTNPIQPATSCISDDGEIRVVATGGNGIYSGTIDGTGFSFSGSNTVTLSAVSAGNHIIEVTSDGCTISKTVNVPATSGLSVTATGGALATCNSTMPITLTISGSGTAPYHYNIDTKNGDFTTSPYFVPEFGAGVYSWEVSDFKGCNANGTVTISNPEPNPLSLDVVAVNASCTQSTGEVKITVHGIPPFNGTVRLIGTTLTTSPHPTTGVATISGVSSGTYKVEYEQGACKYTVADVTIGSNTDPEVRIISAEPTHPTCGTTNGLITVKVMGAVSSNYKYSIDGTSWVTAAGGIITIPSLSAGTYTIWLLDSDRPDCGYYISEPIVLTNTNSDLNITGAGVPAASCVIDDGQINFTVTGGNGAYTYKLFQNGNLVSNASVSGLAATATSGTITGLSTGKYVVEVTSNSCIATTNEIDITAIGGMTVAKTIEGTVCGSATGFIELTPDGSAPYTYIIGGIPGDGSTVRREGLTGGTYTWEITDDNGCFASGEEIVPNTAGFNVTPVVANATCLGNDGSITLNVTPGTYAFLYDNILFPTPFTPPYTITGVTNGLHTIVVYPNGNADCTYTITVNVDKDNTSNLTIVSYQKTDPTACGGDNGEIVFNATGASSYEYRYNNGSWTTMSNPQTIGSLSAGTYEIYVRNAAVLSCGNASQTVVLNPTATDLDFSNIVTPATSCISDNGIIVVTATGGNNSYTGTIDGTGFSFTDHEATLNNVSAGNHTIEITSDGCTISKIVNVSATSGLNATATGGTLATCSSTMPIILTVSGTGTAPYHYSIDTENDDFSTSPHSVSGFGAGSYSWEISDFYGCTANGTVTINTPAASNLTLSAAVTNVSCTENNGIITLTVTGGTPAYTYELLGGSNISGVTSGVFTNLSMGSYTAIVTDGVGCTFTLGNIEVGKNNIPEITFSSVFVVAKPDCGIDNGTIEVMVSGSTAYEYAFGNPPTGWASLPVTNQLQVEAGFHMISIRDANNQSCGYLSRTISVDSEESDLAVNIIAHDATTCSSNNGYITFNITGGNGTYSYQLNGLDVTPTGNAISGLSTGTYVLTVTSGTCVASSLSAEINSTIGLTHAITGVTNAGCATADGAFNVEVTGTPNFTYKLNALELTIPENTYLFNNLMAGVYNLTLSDATGCKFDTAITLTNGNFTVDATSTNVTCIGDGSITLTVSGGSPDFSYDLGNGTLYPFGSLYSTIIPITTTGEYSITVTTSANNCSFTLGSIQIDRDPTTVVPPTVNTVQRFCAGATVANLETINSMDVSWYETSAGGTPLALTVALENEKIYYASQSSSTGCESHTRAAVMVLLDPNIFIEPPSLPGIFELCFPATIADIPTYSQNILWYSAATGGMPLLGSVSLVDGTTYYASLSKGGACESVLRTPVTIVETMVTPEAPIMETPQSFCYGALVGNLATPNSQIRWYNASSGGTQWNSDALLQEITYFAAQRAGACESSDRTPVIVNFNGYPAPTGSPVQTICGIASPTLAYLQVSGTGITWYASEIAPTPLSLDTPIANGEIFWAAQSSGTCVSDRLKVTVTDQCYSPAGTIFPFVHTGNLAFDNLFVVTVKLFTVPPPTTVDKVAYIRKQSPIHTIGAVYYDASTSPYITGIPRFPGEIGEFDNPGLPMNWSIIGLPNTTGSAYTTANAGEQPSRNIGIYYFHNVAPGTYIMEIATLSTLPRYAKITISSDNPLGHRELIRGDINGDRLISAKDISAWMPINSSTYGYPPYDIKGDFDGNQSINGTDRMILGSYLSVTIQVYQETKDFINGL